MDPAQAWPTARPCEAVRQDRLDVEPREPVPSEQAEDSHDGPRGRCLVHQGPHFHWQAIQPLHGAGDLSRRWWLLPQRHEAGLGGFPVSQTVGSPT